VLPPDLCRLHQTLALRRNLDHRNVRTREAHGRELSYIEGWYAISEANRIFGFDGWSRETIETKCVLARENRGTFLAVYIARVRITVHADGATVIREGHGTGEGRGTSPGEVHDIALKAAKTDATKRALATFGKPFGLALYGSGKTAIGELMTHLNEERPIRRLGVTRRQLLEQIDRPALKSLPAEPYEFSEWRIRRVGIDYHIEVAAHYYSVPHRFARAEVDARLTARTVEVFLKGERIAAHMRYRPVAGDQ
jgi:hypothetical protein